MAEIRRLAELDAVLLRELICGYTTTAVYAVTKAETPELTRIELRLQPLDRPLEKRYPEPDEAEVARYAALAAEGHCFGAFAEGRCVGIALTEPQAWNRSLWVHELHVAPERRGRGLGRGLLEAAGAHARELGMRCVECETQTTNTAAIAFYRAMGFTLDGVDLSLYTNEDRERGEVAVYMKLAIGGRQG